MPLTSGVDPESSDPPDEPAYHLTAAPVAESLSIVGLLFVQNDWAVAPDGIAGLGTIVATTSNLEDPSQPADICEA